MIQGQVDVGGTSCNKYIQKSYLTPTKATIRNIDKDWMYRFKLEIFVLHPNIA